MAALGALNKTSTKSQQAFANRLSCTANTFTRLLLGLLSQSLSTPQMQHQLRLKQQWGETLCIATCISFKLVPCILACLCTPCMLSKLNCIAHFLLFSFARLHCLSNPAVSLQDLEQVTLPFVFWCLSFWLWGMLPCFHNQEGGGEKQL